MRMGPTDHHVEVQDVPGSGERSLAPTDEAAMPELTAAPSVMPGSGTLFVPMSAAKITPAVKSAGILKVEAETSALQVEEAAREERHDLWKAAYDSEEATDLQRSPDQYA